MAVANSLAKTQAQPKSDLVKYNSNGEEIQISKSMIRSYLVSGDKNNVTDQEITMFLSLCKFQHLNPFLREAYLIKYGSNPATIVVGKDVLLKRAMRSDKFEGLAAGIIVVNLKGEIEEREGSFALPDEKLVGGWAKVIIKDYSVPFYTAVSMSEYSTGKSNWVTRPATMIRKVAVAQALREAFPEEMSALYEPSEMDKTVVEKTGQEIVELDSTPIVIPSDNATESVETENVITTAQAVTTPVQTTLGAQGGIDDIVFPNSIENSGSTEPPFEI